jgi:hypothetical protein
MFFGDIPAGKVTDYKTVSLGVYRYAAYEYSFSGRQVNQYVVDWVGENPLQGERFTYRINFNTNNKIGNQIELLEVTVDAP